MRPLYLAIVTIVIAALVVGLIIANSPRSSERSAEAASRNKKQGEEFLAANKQKEGVVELPSGLQYRVLKEGTGNKPRESDVVAVLYRGTLLDGTVFDSAEDPEQPFVTPVTRVIRGWTEAVELMQAGSKWRVFVPSRLAYGPAGNSGIGPNETLIFDIELLKIK